MGAQTAAEIVSEGQLLAGRDDNATASLRWLQRWLDSVAASWPWPVLETSAQVVLTGGAGSVTIGAGQGGVPLRVHKVNDNLWLYNVARTIKRRVRLKQLRSDPADIIDAAVQQGPPSQARVLSIGNGKWTLSLFPTPLESYLLYVPYWFLPASIVLDTETPWYPNDETMVQAVAFKNHEFYDGKDAPVTNSAQQMLAGMVAADRTRYGSAPGTNDNLFLDPSIFRTRS